MDHNEPTNQPAYAATATPGMLSTSLPSTISFAIAVLLFLLPFIDIKCNGMKLQDVKGYQLATGFTMKEDKADNMLDNSDRENENRTTTTTKVKGEKKEANIFAMIAMLAGVVGLVLCFVKNRTATGAAIIAGVAGAAALIGLFIDVKRKVKLDLPSNSSGNNRSGTDSFTNDLSGISISVDFTPWYYIAVIAFLAGAYFCYKRMQALK